jgi:PHS family inorganic phosphate transporter-like MFS transporter
MLAAVFLMQPLGQLCAYGAGLTTLRIFGDTRVDVDKQWRYVIGVGTLPTLLALGFRLFMPESGRYTYDVLRTVPQHSHGACGTATRSDGSDSSTRVQNFDDEDEIADHVSLVKIWHFLFHEGHWPDLLGTSMCWALLDFAFCKSHCAAKIALKLEEILSTDEITAAATTRANNRVDGLGFSTPTTLKLLWPPKPEHGIKDELSNNMTRGIETFPIAGILGSIAIIACIDWINRKHMLTLTFCVLAIVLAVAAGSIEVLSRKDTFSSYSARYILVILWNLASFLFSFGPNTLTFIVSSNRSTWQG